MVRFMINKTEILSMFINKMYECAWQSAVDVLSFKLCDMLIYGRIEYMHYGHLNI